MNLSYARDVAPLDLRDPLSETLGAQSPGEPIRYTFEDAAKAAGHVCPTVAGAWLVTRAALAALYEDATPVRGEVQVEVGGPPERVGAFGQVIGYLTGAAGDAGFGGLFGRFRRRDLLRFVPELAGWTRFTRLDTGAAVEVRYDPSQVPDPPGLGELFSLALRDEASEEQRRRFGELWQRKVGSILTEHAGSVVELRAA